MYPLTVICFKLTSEGYAGVVVTCCSPLSKQVWGLWFSARLTAYCYKQNFLIP